MRKKLKGPRMPKNDPIAQKQIWQIQLDRIATAQHKIKLEAIDLGKIDIELSMRELKIKDDKERTNLRSDFSHLKKLKIENRMKSLCLDEQKKKLENAINRIQCD